MDDFACGTAGLDVDHAGEERVVGVASHDHVPGRDALGILGFIEVGPHMAGVVDLQVQAYLYAVAEQFGTLLYAMRRHERGSDSFFESFVASPTNLQTIIGDVTGVDRTTLLALVGDPSDAVRPPDSEAVPSLDPADVATVNIGGIEVPERIIDDQAFDNLVLRAGELVDLVVTNIGQLREMVEAPEPIPGANRQPQSLRAVDNSFRHGLRLLFHEASPADRTFRVDALTSPPEPPGVDLYLPVRGKAAAESINFATISCTPGRTEEHLASLRQLSLRTGQLARAFAGFQITGRPDQLLAATSLELPISTGSLPDGYIRG
ncbi:MAG: hypothetical protein U5K29_08045 [Acidimicrobiales bacterium]|nr:hypothetical protein [Acidimicrobiales bacterium]